VIASGTHPGSAFAAKIHRCSSGEGCPLRRPQRPEGIDCEIHSLSTERNLAEKEEQISKIRIHA
jgi:hypothetical protein